MPWLSEVMVVTGEAVVAAGAGVMAVVAHPSVVAEEGAGAMVAAGHSRVVAEAAADVRFLAAAVEAGAVRR
jgi:hypothetical protein